MRNDSSSLVTEFLLAYNEFEFAVKSAGYVRGDLAGAWANWMPFAKALKGKFAADSPELAEAVAYFEESPPQKQIIRDGKVLWREHRPNTTTEAQLVLYLRRIQNGIYQGPELLGDNYSGERFNELIRHGLVLIEAFRRHCNTDRQPDDHDRELSCSV